MLIGKYQEALNGDKQVVGVWLRGASLCFIYVLSCSILLG